MKRNRKGFTLIELLIVIAIIAVLATVVILSLNPAELLRQARDSNRASDAATMKSAIALYLADVATPVMGTSGYCYMSIATGTSFYTPIAGATYGNGATTSCTVWMPTATNASNSVVRAIDGTGWIHIPFNAISSGAPIGQEPVDPVQSFGTSGCAAANLSSCGLFYSYVMSGTNYKMGMQMESLKYATGTTGIETTDGGSSNFMFEAGTSLSL